MINIVYSNTSYLDILNIQSDYISKFSEKTLFINKNEIEMDEIYSKYDRVIFYDDSKEYSARLIECLSQLDCDYITFMHDIDILIEMDEEKMTSFYSFMRERGIDRIDLKYTKDIEGHELIRVDSKSPKEWVESEYVEVGGLYLVKQTNPEGNANLFNVNPSIWKRDSLLGMLNNFPNKTYRSIEELDVQAYCSNMQIYKIHCDKPLQCGYFECTPPFVYLHITHGGRLLLLDGRNVTEYGQSYSDLAQEYVKIAERYNLRNSSKSASNNTWRI